MRKPTFCICENIDADQLRSYREADQCLCFHYTDVQCLLYLKSKFQDSGFLLCSYNSVCVRSVRKPLCWFSHDAAQLKNSPAQQVLGQCQAIRLVLLLFSITLEGSGRKIKDEFCFKKPSSGCSLELSH